MEQIIGNSARRLRNYVICDRKFEDNVSYTLNLFIESNIVWKDKERFTAEVRVFLPLGADRQVSKDIMPKSKTFFVSFAENSYSALLSYTLESNIRTIDNNEYATFYFTSDFKTFGEAKENIEMLEEQFIDKVRINYKMHHPRMLIQPHHIITDNGKKVYAYAEYSRLKDKFVIYKTYFFPYNQEKGDLDKEFHYIVETLENASQDYPVHRSYDKLSDNTAYLSLTIMEETTRSTTIEELSSTYSRMIQEDLKKFANIIPYELKEISKEYTITENISIKMFGEDVEAIAEKTLHYFGGCAWHERCIIYIPIAVEKHAEIQQIYNKVRKELGWVSFMNETINQQECRSFYFSSDHKSSEEAEKCMDDFLRRFLGTIQRESNKIEQER